MRIRTIPLLMSAIFLVFIPSCSGKSGSWVRELIDPDGVRVVENGPYPVMRLEDEAVIGQGRDEEEYLFSTQPGGAVVTGGPNGQVGYTERQPPELRVFGPGGDLHWKAGRDGEGPGEFRVPMRPGFVPGIGWIVDAPLLSRLVVFDENGGFSRIRSLDLVPPAHHFSQMGYCPNGDFWLLTHRSRVRDEGQFFFYQVVWVEWDDLRYASADSFEQISVISDDQFTYMYEENPANLAVDGRGRAWVNGVFPYQIDIYDPEGSGHWRIRREYDLVGFPSAYRESVESEPLMEMDGETWYLKLPPEQPAIRGLNWTDQGEMWVFQSAWVDSPLVQVDVFDEEGIFQRAFLADRSLRGMPIGLDHLWRSDVAEDGSPLLIYSRYWFEEREE
ncbi:hypothetical protein ACFL3H_10585 [Gemmatimonadota bacterium]